MTDQLRLAIVDHYPIFRDGVVRALRKHKNIVVAAEGATAKEAEQFASTKAIDILLFEIAVLDSMRAAQAIMRAHPTTKVVFLASTDDDAQAARALRTGAHGYIMKGITGPDLIRAVESIHSGERYITSDLAWRLLTKPTTDPKQGTAYGKPLSLREQQVLEHSSKGLTNQEIARVLGLNVSTIKYYKTLAFRKVGARNRLEAIFVADRGVKDN